MFDNNGILFLLILLLLFSFTGSGINSSESLILIFSAFALLLAGQGGFCLGKNI